MTVKFQLYRFPTPTPTYSDDVFLERGPAVGFFPAFDLYDTANPDRRDLTLHIEFDGFTRDDVLTFRGERINVGDIVDGVAPATGTGGGVFFPPGTPEVVFSNVTLDEARSLVLTLDWKNTSDNPGATYRQMDFYITAPGDPPGAFYFAPFMSARQIVTLNDAPNAADVSVRALPNADVVLGRDAFSYVDAESHGLAAVRINTLPDVGKLTLDGVAVTQGQFIDAAKLDAGGLVYTLNGSTNPGSFTFQLRDNGGVAYEGRDLDPTPNTLTITPLVGLQSTGGGYSERFVGTASDVSVDLDAGSDTYVGGAGEETVSGGAGDDVLSAGAAGDSGFNFLHGNQGADTITGGGGTDWLRGGQGDDLVFGGSGNDWLSGDRGDDTVTGGPGADTFHSFGEAGTDVVTDFNFAEGDRVSLLAGTSYEVKQVGEAVVITMSGGGQMVLQNVQLSVLGEGWLGVF